MLRRARQAETYRFPIPSPAVKLAAIFGGCLHSPTGGHMRFSLMVCLLTAIVLGTSGLLSAQAPAPVPAPGSCANLLVLQLPDITIKSADEVPGPAFMPPGSSAHLQNLPAFCRVVAVTKPAITVEVWLPLTTWNASFRAWETGAPRYDQLRSAGRRHPWRLRHRQHRYWSRQQRFR